MPKAVPAPCIVKAIQGWGVFGHWLMCNWTLYSFKFQWWFKPRDYLPVKMVCSGKKETESGQQASKCMFLINVVSSLIKRVVSRTLQENIPLAFVLLFRVHVKAWGIGTLLCQLWYSSSSIHLAWILWWSECIFSFYNRRAAFITWMMNWARNRMQSLTKISVVVFSFQPLNPFYMRGLISRLKWRWKVLLRWTWDLSRNSGTLVKSLAYFLPLSIIEDMA